MKTVTKRAAALSMLLTLAVIAAFAWSTLGASAAGSSVTINLKSVTGSKAVGTGVITDNGDGTIKVVMTMQGLEPGDHIDHIHTGSCAAQGAVVYPLTNLTAECQWEYSANFDYGQGCFHRSDQRHLLPERS